MARVDRGGGEEVSSRFLRAESGFASRKLDGLRSRARK